MDLKAIRDKLNREFRSDERKLIFWYDDKGEFEGEIDSLELENAKIHKLTGSNVFYTKYFLECEDKEGNYLIYAPFPKPPDSHNHLTDMVYYSKQFYADRISLLSDELNVPERYKEKLHEFSKFWRAKERLEKFESLDIESYNPETIEIGILSVLSGVKTPIFEEIVKRVIMEDSFGEDNRYFESFRKMDALEAFWGLCEKYYGYTDEKPSLEKLIATLLVTYTSDRYRGELPKSWQAYVSHKKNDIVVFVSNMMNNVIYQDEFDKLTEQMARKIKALEYFSGVPAENYFECDTFDLFDEGIIDHMSGLMVSNGEPLSNEYSEVVRQRGKKKHFSAKYSEHYRAINRADKLISGIQSFSNDFPKDVEEAVKMYIEKWSKIDKYYRGFYTAFDKIEASDRMYELRELVEKMYTNSYLMKLSVIWGDKLEQLESLGNLSGKKQYDFYRNAVEMSVIKENTVVIISDGFRYEAGTELQGRFKDRPNTKVELDYMISAIPSYTKLGMASLLPHKSISFTDSYDVLVDGENCITSEQRGKILSAYNPNSLVTSYSEVMGMSRNDLRKLTGGKELIYVYHNQVDARGDNASTENEVFSATKESMDEIMSLVQKLTVDKSITSYIITSDHGFIYKRDKLEESDKVSLGKKADAVVNKRFILSRDKLDLECSVQFSMDYLGAENEDIFVTMPRGVDIFKVPGSGQNYVHGGASLQEIIVPLIKVKTERGKQEVQNVEVVLTSISRKITGLRVYQDFMQTENISESLRPAKIRAYFETESGEKISDEELIVADKKNASPEKRQFKGNFTLKQRRYPKSDKYYLIMIDVSSDMEVARHEFMIDIPFADDFEFDL